MTELDLTFEGKVLRIIDRNDSPWFVLADVCKALGIGNVTEAARSLEADEKAKFTLSEERSSQKRQMVIVSEPGALQIIMRSDAAITPGTFAYRFRRWVTHEVLPSIRKFGFYDPARLAAAEVLDGEELQIPAERHDRFLQEARRYEERTGRSVLDIPGISKQKLSQIRLGSISNRMLSRGDLWLYLIACRFDMHYILWGERQSEREQREQAARVAHLDNHLLENG